MKVKRNYTIKVYQAQKVERYRTKSLRRFLRHIRTIKWQDSMFKVYLRISYGKIRDVWGKEVTAYNDGTYTNEKDFNLAQKAFLEE